MNEGLTCSKLLEDCLGGNLQSEVFCGAHELSNYTEFSIWMDVVFGDTAAPVAFELELLTSTKTFNLLFEDWTY